MKKYTLYLLIPVFFLSLLLLPAQQAQAGTPYEKNGKLSISNGQVVNSQGKAFVIQGVSTHGLAWYPKYVNKETFRDLRDNWNVNTIRLALYTSEYGGYCSGGSKTNLEKLVQQGVSYATDLGMYVIIDWHVLNDGSDGGNPLRYRTQALSFFRKMAKKYASNSHVLYEICNEPNGSGGSWKNIRSYAASVIKAIRTYSKDSIIIVGTPTWSQDVEEAAAKPITGYKNIAYAFHFYAGTHTDTYRKRLETVLKKKLPVIVTEFGISDASGGGSANTSQGQSWITLLNKYKVGRIAWNLSNKSETTALINSSCSKISGFSGNDLTAYGRWLKKVYTGSSSAASTSKTSTTTETAKTSTTAAANTSSSGTAASGTTVGTASSAANGLKASVQCVNTWSSGGYQYAQYTVKIRNAGKSAVSGWKVRLSFSSAFAISQSWCGTYKKSGTTLDITPLSWNKKLAKNASTEVGFILRSKKTERVSRTVIGS